MVTTQIRDLPLANYADESECAACGGMINGDVGAVERVKLQGSGITEHTPGCGWRWGEICKRCFKRPPRGWLIVTDQEVVPVGDGPDPASWLEPSRYEIAHMEPVEVKKIPPDEDWRRWVYGGAENPNRRKRVT